MKAAIAALLIASSAGAQPSLAPPQIGYMQDAANSLRPVYGVAGNFVVGGPAATGVVAAAFSDSYRMWKTDSSLVVATRRGEVITTMDAPPGDAAFAFSQDGAPALAYFPSVNLLFEWCSGSFQMVPFDWTVFPADAVLAIAAPDPSHAALIVQRNDGVWEIRVLLSSGEVGSQVALPGVSAPALLLPSGDLVASDAKGIFVRRQDGTEIHLEAALPARFSLQQMGEGWVEIRNFAGGPSFALRTTPNHEGLYTLPEVAQ